MFIKRQAKTVDDVNQDVRVYLQVPIEYKEQAKQLGAQQEKPKLRIKDAEYAKRLRKHKKRAIYDHGEWTDEDKKHFKRMWDEHL